MDDPLAAPGALPAYLPHGIRFDVDTFRIYRHFTPVESHYRVTAQDNRGIRIDCDLPLCPFTLAPLSLADYPGETVLWSAELEQSLGAGPLWRTTPETGR